MKRLLTASVLGIAGTVGSVLLSTIETPALATLLLAGGVNSLVGILGGVIANDGSVVWDKIGEKLQDNDTILQNNDLKKAVGIAIAAIIAQTAKDENKVNLAYKSHIKKLGKYTVDNWVKLCNEGIISLNEAIFTPIQEHNLSGLMLRKSDEVKFSRVFNTDEIKDKEVWKSLVEIIIENSRILSELKTIEEEKIVIDNIIDSLAEALSNNFLKAFREVLKEDFANGGKAFAGFTMDMFKDLQQGINESNNLILKKLDNLTINDTEEDSQLLTELAKSYNCTVENKKEIKNKLNEEFKQINQKLAALQSNNTEEFRKLGNKIDSEFENIRELLKEIDVKLDELLNITVSIKDETGEILQTVRRLEEQQLISQQNTAPSLLITGDAPKAIANWQGRIKELENIRKWILNPDVNLVGVDGIGGMGKSSLVGKIFADKQDDELNKKVTKRYWADVSNGALFVDVARKVLDKFEGEEKKRDEKQLVDDLLKCLQSGQHLLVLDNLESLLLPNRTFKDSYYQEFFNAWCEFGHQTTIVVTTREKPSLQGMEWINLEGLKVEEGANLLRELGIKGDLAGFSELVGGYPLLLKLVADLLKDEEVGYPEDPDLKRLDSLGLGNLGEILTDERVKGQHRRETVGMVAVLDATTSRLTLQQKAFWCRLSVYQQGFDKVAASFMGEGEVEAELRKLSNRSLLQRSLIGDDYVYQFQPVVKEYALIGLGDATDAHLRAINYYLSILQLHPNNKKTMQPYLETFYHWCQLGDYDTAFDVLREVDRFLTLQGFYGVLVQSYSELVEAFQEENDPHNWKYGASLTDLGVAYDSLGEYQTAIDYHQQSLTISREIGYRQGEGSSLGNLGVAYDSLGEYQTAIDYHQQYLTISREIGDRQGEAKSLGGLGNAYNSLGEYQTAIDYHQQYLTISREIGDRQGEGNSLGNLGVAYDLLGEYQTAIEYHQQYLTISREIGYRQGEGGSLVNLGNAYNSLGEYQTAIEYHQQSLTIFREIGDRQGEGNSLGSLGNAYNSLGEYQTAIDYYQQSLTIFREIGYRRGEANSLGSLGNAYNSLGEYQTAIDYHQQSLTISREIGDRQGEGNSLGNLGNAYQLLGEYQTAIDYHQQSLTISREIGYRQGEGNSLGNLGNAYNSLGEYQTAIEYHQQYLTISREIGYRQGEGISLGSLGNAYNSLGEYQTAIDYYQQSLTIAEDIGAIYSVASFYYNLGNTYEKLNRKKEAIQSYHYARELYQRIGLGSKIQNCDNQINTLSSSQRLSIWQRIKRILQRFLQWLRSHYSN